MSQQEQASLIEVDNKRTINAWAMFDWANSSYALVIAVAIFPIYFNGVLPEGEFEFLGFTVTSTSLNSYAITLAYFVIAISLPLLSGIADYGGKRMRFMKFFTLMGSIACMLLIFFTADNISLGFFGFAIATIGFAGGQVFYNSFLPLIASEKQLDKVSAKGFTFGYIGSVILLLFILFLIEGYAIFGFESREWPTRISFVLVGLWWIGFAQISFARLPKDKPGKITKTMASKGYQELMAVLQIVKKETNIKRFLFSFFFYIGGANTVIFLAATFATVELKFEALDLIITILLIQFLGIIGAILFSRISEWKGNKLAILIMIVIWFVICITAFFVTQKIEFYILAGTVGLVMGGIQSLSRSTYSKLLPKDTTDTTSFFSFFDVLEKLAIMFGTLAFGYIDLMTGGMRNSVLALTVFFVIGFVSLLFVKMKPQELEVT